jgi:hypothetical protein
MKTENKNVEPAKKAYVKPVVTKHAAATQIVGSSCGCGYLIATYGNGVYYI